MSKEEKKDTAIEAEGTIVELLRGRFRVQLDNGHQLIAHLGGKLRKNFIRLVAGDRVKVEISPYDLTRGRIIYRNK